MLYQGVSGTGRRGHARNRFPSRTAFNKRFGNFPSYAGYTAYDEVYYIADAVKRAGSTDADKLVDALEKTDWVGTIGRVQFYGKDDPFTHSIKYGKGLITGLDAAVAGRQAGRGLAEGSRQGPVEVPELHQGHVELISARSCSRDPPGSIFVICSLSKVRQRCCRGRHKCLPFRS